MITYRNSIITSERLKELRKIEKKPKAVQEFLLIMVIQLNVTFQMVTNQMMPRNLLRNLITPNIIMETLPLKTKSHNQRSFIRIEAKTFFLQNLSNSQLLLRINNLHQDNKRKKHTK